MRVSLQVEEAVDELRAEAYCLRHIRDVVAAAGPSIPPTLGRAPHYPRGPESVLFRFVAKLRSMKMPVYKSTVVDYATRLLTGTQHALRFADVKEGAAGGPEGLSYEWDMVSCPSLSPSLSPSLNTHPTDPHSHVRLARL